MSWVSCEDNPFEDGLPLSGELENKQTNSFLMLGFVFPGDHLLRVGKKGTEDKTQQPKISEDNLPTACELPDETCANDGWNSEDYSDSRFSFWLHLITP
jgi:hypothetical protein